MSPTPTSQTDESEPGQLLYELERRQDEALSELEALESRLRDVLAGLGVATDEGVDPSLT